MPNRIAKFEKVSYEQFEKDYISAVLFHAAQFHQETIKDDEYKSQLSTDPVDIHRIYDNIKIPERGTSQSAGYDFFAPFNFRFPADGRSILIPTGIRCKIDDGWMLAAFPRSGLGFKYRVALDNTVGIIDADYYNAKNEGHIMLKLHTDTMADVDIDEGQGIAQGIFIPYGITFDDAANKERIGGIGSTDKKE